MDTRMAPNLAGVGLLVVRGVLLSHWWRAVQKGANQGRVGLALRDYQRKPIVDTSSGCNQRCVPRNGYLRVYRLYVS